MIKQFVPSEYCLKCLGCCRFSKQDSVWSPCLLEEEAVELVDKEGIPPVSISINRKLQLIPNPQGNGFICPFLRIEDNHCQIYFNRPFECQLYPFLLNMRNNKIWLTVDLNCPFIKEKINSPEFKEYVGYLAAHLNSPKKCALLKNNPNLLQAYEDVLAVMELGAFDGIK